jgi:hypothetical protein
LRVLKHPNKVGLSGFLKGEHGSRLNPHVQAAPTKSLHDFSDQPLEGELADEKLRGLLVLADFPQGYGARAVAMGLLGGTAGGWGGLARSLSCELFPRGSPPKKKKEEREPLTGPRLL